MIQAGLADPGCWEGNVHRFIVRAIRGWMKGFGSEEIDDVFGLSILATTKPNVQDSMAEDMTDRLYLTLYPQPDDHWGMVLGDWLTPLLEVDHRLPSIFWHRYAGALRRLGLEVWDHDHALEEELYGFYGDWIDERNEEAMAHEDEPDLWERPSHVIPSYLRRGHVKDSTVRRILSTVERSSNPRRFWAAALVRGAMDLHAATLGIPTRCELLTEEEKVDWEVDDVEGYPSLVAWIQDGDPLAHLWDMNGEHLQYSGFEPAAVVTWPMPFTPEGVRQAYTWAERHVSGIRRAARLLTDFQYPDGVPLAISLNRVEVRA